MVCMKKYTQRVYRNKATLIRKIPAHMTKKKIVIIGAGPVGCYTAQILKLYGFRPSLVEEHNEIGRPVHCTGLVGKGVFADKRPFPISDSSILNVINGAVIHYDDRSFAIKRADVAYVIDREKFDKELSKGLDITYQNKFIGLEKSRGGYIVETDKGELFGDVVIGADGANSLIRGILNPGINGALHYKGVQFRIKARPRHADMVDVYLKKSSFFWIVPESKHIIRVGTISENPYADLQIFLKEEKINGDILEKFGGVVNIGMCGNTVKDNIAIVGDAALQMKPLTYGGMYFGLKAAAILAQCIKDNRIERYDSLWKKELGFEIKMGLRAREIYNRLNNKELEIIFGLIKKEGSLIEKIGDFENHSRLILEIFQIFIKITMFRKNWDA